MTISSIKALLGAIVVMIISLLTQMKNYYLAGLVPLFHYIVGSERTLDELKNTILFSLYGMIPLFVYLVAIYTLVDLMPLKWALACASALWCLPAAFLLILWMKSETSIA